MLVITVTGTQGLHQQWKDLSKKSSNRLAANYGEGE